MMRQMNPDSLKGMASLLQQYGRNGDTMLAHINPKEAMLLDRVSGGGSMNPMTGMPEFYGGDSDGDADADAEGDSQGSVGDDPGLGGSPSDGPDPDPTGPARGDIGAEIDMMEGVVDADASLGLVDGSLPGPGSLDGAGGLFGNLMPDRPGILDVLTAPLETLVSALTLGTVDPEFTGKDVFGVPGLPSSDLSRGISGIPGAQPVGVEIGFSPVGTVGIDQSGISGYAGPVTDFFSGLMSPDAAKSLVSTNPDLANQLANEKQSAALDAALANLKSSSGKAADAIAGYLDKARGEPEFSTTTNFYSPPPTASGIGLSMYGVGQPVNTSPPTSDWDDPANIQARVDAARAATAQYNAQNTPIGPDIDQEIIDMTYGKDSFTNTNIGPPSLAPNEYATTPTYAQGGPVSLGSLYNNVRARRGPITGGQRSGGGIMSLR